MDAASELDLLSSPTLSTLPFDDSVDLTVKSTSVSPTQLDDSRSCEFTPRT